MALHDYVRKFTIPSPPTVDNDETEGYEVLDVVYVGEAIYDCKDASAGAAVWVQRGASGEFDLAAETHAATHVNMGTFDPDSEMNLWDVVTGLLRKMTFASFVDYLFDYFSSSFAFSVHNHGPGNNQVDHGSLSGLSDDDHTQYIKHSLATAANDFLVASGSGAFIKKTLAEAVTILRTVLDTVFAPIANGVTNGDSHNHVGGDGAALNYIGAIGAFLDGNTVPAASTYHSTPFRHGVGAGAGNFPWPEAGVLSNLSIRTASAQPGTGSLVVTLLINNAASSIVITIAAGSAGGTYSDNTHTETIVAGDVIRWTIQNNAPGAASAQLTAMSMKITKQTT